LFSFKIISIIKTKIEGGNFENPGSGNFNGV